MNNKFEKVHVSVTNIEKSWYELHYHVPTSFNFGELIPVNFMPLLGNHNVKINLACKIIMSTPIKPFMSNIWADIYPVFVPYRLLLRGSYGFGQKTGSWEELFTGHNEDTNWITPQDIPDIEPINGEMYLDQVNTRDNNHAIGNYLFLPNLKNVVDKTNYNVSPLVGRGVFFAWNELFRSEKVSKPYEIAYENDGQILLNERFAGEALTRNCLKVSKTPDYYTSLLPAPLPHGESVAINLSSTAPIIFQGSNALSAGTYGFGFTNSSGGIPQKDLSTSTGVSILTNTHASTGAGSLKVDLSNATAITLDALREAVALQHLLQNDARGGLRYFEELYSHFGIAPESDVLQRPQVLGHRRVYINVNQVLSNAGAEDGTTTKLGSMGAVSVTVDRSNICNYTAPEPGILYFFVTTRHDQIYGQGIPAEFYRFNRLDFIWPEFAHSSALAVNTRLIDAEHASYNDVLGYQDYGDEFRFIPDRVSGQLNPSVDESLNYWTLAQDFGEKPTMSEQFIYENRDALSRGLVTGNSGPDFIADFFFGGSQVLPLPATGTPGLKVL